MAEPLVESFGENAAAAQLLTPALDLAEVIVQLSDLGPPSEVRSRTPRLAAELLGLDRVILSSVSQGRLLVEALHSSVVGDSENALKTLRAHPVMLEYPLIEGEIMRRRRAQLVTVADEDSTGRYAFADILEWTEYVVAPIVLDGTVLGFLHADRLASGRCLHDSDASSLAAFTLCFGVVYDRAVLRQRLRVQRQELREIASWADARTGELDTQAATLHDDLADADLEAVRLPDLGTNALRDLLTRRELEVLKLMVNGETNAGIARALVLSEGTAKFHVKNILRKMHATNRADATARYLRLTLSQSSQHR
jgi:LuxR family transcriptional regulator, regulator of acetate metabolism